MDVPELVANGRTYRSDEEKAKLLIATFFPTLPIPTGPDPDPIARSDVEPDI